MGTLKSAATRPARAGMDRLLYWRWYPGTFHLLFFAGLVVLIYFAFNPVRRAEGNLATEVVWKLWWPGLPFILLLGGRIWCGICPFGAAADFAARLGSKSAAPSLLRSWGPWMGALSVFFFGLAFLALGLEENPGATGVILIAMILLAFGMTVLYKGRTFCRYLCPVGMITRVYSFFSWLQPVGGGVRYKAVSCPAGQSPQSLRQPSQCQMCGACTLPDVSGIRTTFGVSGGRLPGVREFGRPEAFLSLLLLGLMAADSVRMTPLFARYQQFALPYFDYNYRLSVIGGVSALVGAVLAVQLLGSWLVWRQSRDSRAFAGMAFSYLPLSLGVFLALALQHLRYGLWPSLETVMAESRLFGWDGHMPPDNVYFTSIPLKSVQFVILGIGLYLSWRLTRSGLGGESSRGGIASRRFMVLAAAAGFGYLFLIPMSGAC